MLYPPEWLAKIHYDQMLEEAAGERLTRGNHPPARHVGNVLDRVGDALIQLGLWLKRHRGFLPHA